MNEEITNYNLALAIDCEYDWDFIRLIEKSARQIGLSTYVVWPENVGRTIELLDAKQIHFNYLYDRASDTSPYFKYIYRWIIQSNAGLFEIWENIEWASDKATMHLEFIAGGMRTPYTIILPPYGTEERIILTVEDLAHLGRPFIIKPANTTGGGIGVVDGAETLHDVLLARKEFGEDKYLLQEKVQPLIKDGKRFWFRCFYTCGLIQCAWWDDQTHRYEKLLDEEIERYQLHPLKPVVQKIAVICRLNFFSTEIAVTEGHHFIVIDYVNEICDMRLKSHHFDGVLDEIVENISVRIATYVKTYLGHKKFEK